MTNGLSNVNNAELWIQRVRGYVADPDGKFSHEDLKSPETFLKHVAEAYDLRRPRCNTEAGRTALAEVCAITEAMK